MNELVKITVNQVQVMLGQIRSASSLVDLTEARARIEAARAWAKVHKQVKEMRLDLLRVETEALVRIVELGGVEDLPARDRKAARYLAAMSFEERAEVVAKSGQMITTASGMVRAIWTAEDLDAERKKNRRLGEHLATHPDIETDEDLRRLARESTYRIEDVLTKVLADHAAEGEPFSVTEMAEDVIQSAAIGSSALDPDVEEGVREVCRAAIRRAPTVFIDGTILPRFVTARDKNGHHFRTPVENACLWHLDSMVEQRRDALAADTEKLRQLEAACERLHQVRGAERESRIGDLVCIDLSRRSA